MCLEILIHLNQSILSTTQLNRKQCLCFGLDESVFPFSPHPTVLKKKPKSFWVEEILCLVLGANMLFLIHTCPTQTKPKAQREWEWHSGAISQRWAEAPAPPLGCSFNQWPGELLVPFPLPPKGLSSSLPSKCLEFRHFSGAVWEHPTASQLWCSSEMCEMVLQENERSKSWSLKCQVSALLTPF